jgi:hypothetical protein
MASSIGTLYTPMHSGDVSPLRHAAWLGFEKNNKGCEEEERMVAIVLVVLLTVDKAFKMAPLRLTFKVSVE